MGDAAFVQQGAPARPYPASQSKGPSASRPVSSLLSSEGLRLPRLPGQAGRTAGNAACGAAPAGRGRGRPHPGGRCPAAGPRSQPRQPPAAAPPTPGLGFRAHGLPQPPRGTVPSPLAAHFASETHVPSVTAVLPARPAPLSEGILPAFEGRPRPQRARGPAPGPPHGEARARQRAPRAEGPRRRTPPGPALPLRSRGFPPRWGGGSR